MREIKVLTFNEGMITNTLFTFKNKMSSYEKGRNHLYDNIDNEIEEAEFTDADLKHSVNLDDKSVVVKSTPTKYSQVVQHDDPNNPYINPYLDSDLSTTIGKNKKNRM